MENGQYPPPTIHKAYILLVRRRRTYRLPPANIAYRRYISLAVRHISLLPKGQNKKAFAPLTPYALSGAIFPASRERYCFAAIYLFQMRYICCADVKGANTVRPFSTYALFPDCPSPLSISDDRIIPQISGKVFPFFSHLMKRQTIYQLTMENGQLTMFLRTQASLV